MDRRQRAADRMDVSHLPDPQARQDWPVIERMLTPALSGDDLLDPAIDVVWIAYDSQTLFGAVTTRLRTDGIAELRLVGGARFREWIGPVEEMVSEWARNCGSPKLISRGRKGWGRFAAAFGWVALGTDDENKMLFEKVL